AAIGCCEEAAMDKTLALGCFGFLVEFMHDVALLRDRYRIVHAPVQHQPRGEEEHHSPKHQRHDHHDACLHRIGRRRVELDLQEHRTHHDGRQDEPAVGCCKVCNPEDPGRATHLYATQQHPVQCNKDRYLNHHGQASAQGVDLFCAIHLHHGRI